jgi:phospholipid/cholesterol/gamma-HCH transport system substrate-binding protein
MEKYRASLGLFVVGGLVLFGIGMFLIGDRHQVFRRHSEYYAEFVNLAGLAKGAKVRVAGMDAGQVLAVDVPDSPASRFRVKWRIDARLAGLVRADSIATIGTEGVVGETYLSVSPGSVQAQQVTPLATIPSKEPVELSALLNGGEGLLNDARKTLNDIGARLSVALDTLTVTASNANDVVVGIKQGRGVAGMLLQDDKLAGQIRASVTNVQQATVDIGHAASQADALVSDLNSRRIPEQAGAVVSDLSDAAKRVREVIVEMTQPDHRGMSAGANIRVSLTNANTATGNLAEATEALKHNFFTRGFFKKRGYYNLTDMSPDKYRRDRTFTNRKNRRLWLSGDELFQPGPDGDEELSASGKALLNDTLAEVGDALVEGPMVIEGYSNGEIPSHRLRLSRIRALAVRQYVQAHYQLDTTALGIVPLKESPPEGMGRATWDGICIVVLKRS